MLGLIVYLIKTLSLINMFVKLIWSFLEYFQHVTDYILHTYLRSYLNMLFQHRVVQVHALQVVLASQLLRLVADLAEGVLRGWAGQQLSAPHEGQELGHLLVDRRLHAHHAVLQLHQEIAVLGKEHGVIDCSVVLYFISSWWAVGPQPHKLRILHYCPDEYYFKFFRCCHYTFVTSKYLQQDTKTL